MPKGQAALRKVPAQGSSGTTSESSSRESSARSQTSSRQSSARQRQPRKAKKKAPSTKLAAVLEDGEQVQVQGLPPASAEAPPPAAASSTGLPPAPDPDDIIVPFSLYQPQLASFREHEAPAPARAPSVADAAGSGGFLWDFDRNMEDGSHASLEVDGLSGLARCRFKKNSSSSCTACLVAPPGRVRAVTLRLLVASKTHDSGSDAVGMCAPAAMERLRSQSIAERTPIIDSDADLLDADSAAESGARLDQGYAGIGVGALGSLVVHTAEGDLPEAQLCRGFGAHLLPTSLR